MVFLKNFYIPFSISLFCTFLSMLFKIIKHKVCVSGLKNVLFILNMYKLFVFKPNFILRHALLFVKVQFVFSLSRSLPSILACFHYLLASLKCSPYFSSLFQTNKHFLSLISLGNFLLCFPYFLTGLFLSQLL